MTFDENLYKKEWQKKHMLSISVKYNRDFVLEFRKALKTLNLKQSDIIRQAMQETIDKAKEA